MSKRKRIRLKADPEAEIVEEAPPQPKTDPHLQKMSKSIILDDKLIADFCSLVKKGLPGDGICDYLYINVMSFWKWLNKGQKYIEGGYRDPELEIYGRFTLAYRHATAEYRLGVTERLHNGDEDHRKYWFRDFSILERRDRKSWGRNDPAGGSEDAIVADEKFL